MISYFNHPGEKTGPAVFWIRYVQRNSSGARIGQSRLWLPVLDYFPQKISSNIKSLWIFAKLVFILFFYAKLENLFLLLSLLLTLNFKAPSDQFFSRVTLVWTSWTQAWEIPECTTCRSEGPRIGSWKCTVNKKSPMEAGRFVLLLRIQIGTFETYLVVLTHTAHLQCVTKRIHMR